jgi:sugar lactone lactonase YvrE
MSKASQAIVSVLLATLIAACGGGGGDSSSSSGGSGQPASTSASGVTSGTSTGAAGSTGSPATTTGSPANQASAGGTPATNGGTTGGDTPTSSGSLPGSSPPVLAASADATQARFFAPNGLQFSAEGDLYVADTLNYTVRKIARNGAVTTLAGSPGVQGSADGTGAAATFTEPRNIALDGAGNVYVTDGSTVRRITQAGVVTTVAGRQGEFGNVDGIGTLARFRSPDGIVIDAAGNLFVADNFTYTIRKITLPSGEVTTFAGGNASDSTDPKHDDTGTRAAFLGPYSLAIDGAGNLYVADVANAPGKSSIITRFSGFIRKITPTAVVSTLAGNFGHTGAHGTDTVPDAQFSYATGLTVDAAGNVTVIDHFDNGNVLKTISPTGAVATRPLNASGLGSLSRLAFDASGNLHASDVLNNTIDRIAADGSVTVVAGKAGETGSANTP